MQREPSQTPKKKSSKKHSKAFTPLHTAQDGFNLLLSHHLPADALVWVTSCLFPRDLLTLSLVSKHLSSHVALDSTWRIAFMRCFFDLDPETPFDVLCQVLLRRTEKTWRNEYIRRFGSVSRWQNSKASTVGHTPHGAKCFPIHFIYDSSALLSASVDFGVVTRSFPASGSVLRGNLDALGDQANANVLPDVSVIALSSLGGTAYVAWGFGSGMVAVSVAPRVHEKTSAGKRKFARCAGLDAHEGRVESLIFCAKSLTFVSGAWDGVVKLWCAKTVRPLWASNSVVDRMGVRDPCIQVAYDSASGSIAALYKSGVLMVWVGLTTAAPTISPYPSHHAVILPDDPNSFVWDKHHITLAIHGGGTNAIVTLHCNSEEHVQRFAVPLLSPNGAPYIKSVFKEGPLGKLTAVKLDLAFEGALGGVVTPPTAETSHTLGAAVPTGPTMRSLGCVVAGDALGRICVWNWEDAGALNPENNLHEVRSLRRFNAHSDGEITTIEISAYVWVTGSSHGTIRVWDALSHDLLRHFSSPAPRPVGGAPWPKVEQIVVDKDRDALVAGVGNRILYWKAGEPGKNPRKLKGQGKPTISDARQVSNERWIQSLEIKDAVHDSRQIMQSSKEFAAAHQARLARKKAYNAPGLDERESLEYALMLSREAEEEKEKRAPAGLAGPTLLQQSRSSPEKGPRPNPTRRTKSSRSPSPQSQHEASSPPSDTRSRAIPLPTHRPGGADYQSPQRTRREPSEGTGVHAGSPSIAKTSPSSSIKSGSYAHVASPSSPPTATSPSSAWNPKKLHWSTTSPRRTSGPGASSLPNSLSDEMDEDLRFALELSLAEAESRKEEGKGA